MFNYINTINFKMTIKSAELFDKMRALLETHG